MHRELIDYLKCPQCGHEKLDLSVERIEENEVRTGSIRCSGCSASYPVADFIPSFIQEQERGKRWRTAWSYKWSKVAKRVRYSDDGDIDFKIKIDYTGAFSRDLTGRTILDAGCGSGQDMARVAAKGAVVIGVDQSEGVYFAREYNKDKNYYRNYHCIRADIFNLPLKSGIFDMIYSNGVLHHTPDTKRAFSSLPSLLKKGGTIAVWVYDRTQYWRLFETFWRPVLCRLPRPVISGLLHAVNRPWYWIYRYRRFVMDKVNPWPGSSVARHLFDLVSLGHLLYILTDYHLHIAVTTDDHFTRYHHAFDCYSPYFAWGHDEAELFDWFEEHGIEVTRISARRCGMIGRKR